MSKNKKNKATSKKQDEVTEEIVSEETPDTTDEATVIEDEFTLEEKLQNELASAQDQLLRARADFDNFRKRKAREMEQVRKLAAEALIRDILPAIDNLNLTLEHVEDADSNLATGVSMVLKQLMDTLNGRGLTPIESLGQKFDPNLHEAMTQMPSEEIEKDHVMQEFQRGYMLRDAILRPSKVVVSSGKPEVVPETDDTNNESAPAE